MPSFSKLTSIGLPALMGMGITLLAIRAIRNESRLAERKMELDLQLGVKSMKGF